MDKGITRDNACKNFLQLVKIVFYSGKKNSRKNPRTEDVAFSISKKAYALTSITE